MPRKNGLDVIQGLRRFIKVQNTKSSVQILEPRFVFLTAYSTRTFRQHARSYNVECVLEKPIQKEILASILQGGQTHDSYADE